MNYAKSSVGFRRRSKRSRARKRGAFAILLLGFAAIWLVAHAHLASRPLAATVQQSRNPSAERSFATAPIAAWTAADRQRLSKDLHSAVVPAFLGAKGWSLAVVDGDGRTIYAERADRAVAPASVQKLIVAASTLDALGPAYRYHTIFAGPASIADGGVLDGNLWLIGSGDPSFQSNDLRNGVGMLARAGLRHIKGGVVVDATALKGPQLNPHWNQDDNGQDYAAPISAVSLDGDTIESQQLIGGVEQRIWTPMEDVTRYVAARVQAMLTARGIAATAPPSAGAAPLESVVLWDHRSAPLQALEAHMLFLSDNHYAEQLLRTLGEESTGSADDAGGIAAERQFLARHGIPIPGLRLVDGSGLSAENRIAAITLARLLAASQASLYLLLPRGGREGTLKEYDFTTALGRVRAKSGHLSDVSSLAGYVTTAHHGRVAFAFLIDGSLGDADTAIVRAVDRLATF
jgi:D-alanyl-D-alanine carboxypeptidase/D-alanyl-D-alanine-endopeptidase (penicillin-binding protein 4)